MFPGRSYLKQMLPGFGITVVTFGVYVAWDEWRLSRVIQGVRRYWSKVDGQYGIYSYPTIHMIKLCVVPPSNIWIHLEGAMQNKYSKSTS